GTRIDLAGAGVLECRHESEVAVLAAHAPGAAVRGELQLKIALAQGQHAAPLLCGRDRVLPCDASTPASSIGGVQQRPSPMTGTQANSVPVGLREGRGGGATARGVARLRRSGRLRDAPGRCMKSRDGCVLPTAMMFRNGAPIKCAQGVTCAARAVRRKKTT